MLKRFRGPDDACCAHGDIGGGVCLPVTEQTASDSRIAAAAQQTEALLALSVLLTTVVGIFLSVQIFMTERILNDSCRRSL